MNDKDLGYIYGGEDTLKTSEEDRLKERIELMEYNIEELNCMERAAHSRMMHYASRIEDIRQMRKDIREGIEQARARLAAFD